MQLKEIRKFGDITIEFKKKYPAGQVFVPSILSETKIKIMFNGHAMSMSQLGFEEILKFLRAYEEKLNINESIKIELKESNNDELSILKEKYLKKFGKRVPPRYANDIEWINQALSSN